MTKFIRVQVVDIVDTPYAYIMASSGDDAVIDWEKAVVHDHNYPKMHMFHARKVMFANATRPLPTVYLFKNDDPTKDAHEPSSKKPRLGEMSSQDENDLEEEEELDVMTSDKVPDLPYDENKVRSVMVECEKYVSLVRLVAKHHHQEEMCVSMYYNCNHGYVLFYHI